MTKSKFIIDIEPSYSKYNSCDITSDDIINNTNINKLCRKFFGRKCESNDINISYNDKVTSLSNCDE